MKTKSLKEFFLLRSDLTKKLSGPWLLKTLNHIQLIQNLLKGVTHIPQEKREKKNK
jgi:hypothetical protein